MRRGRWTASFGTRPVLLRLSKSGGCRISNADLLYGRRASARDNIQQGLGKSNILLSPFTAAKIEKDSSNFLIIACTGLFIPTMSKQSITYTKQLILRWCKDNLQFATEWDSNRSVDGSWKWTFGPSHFIPVRMPKIFLVRAAVWPAARRPAIRSSRAAGRIEREVGPNWKTKKWTMIHPIIPLWSSASSNGATLTDCRTFSSDRLSRDSTDMSAFCPLYTIRECRIRGTRGCTRGGTYSRWWPPDPTSRYLGS